MAPRTRLSQGRLRGQKRISYEESGLSSDLSEEESDTEFSSNNDAIDSLKPSRQSLSRHPRSAHGSTSAKGNESHRDAGKKKRKRQLSLESRKRTARVVKGTEAEKQFPLANLGEKIPKWQELPYHVLIKIFHYACDSLLGDVCKETIIFLLGTARLCKSFMEPVLSVLYYSPPLHPLRRMQRLIVHLASQTEDSALNYRAKIKYLDLEPQCPPVHIEELLKLTPLLRGLRIYFWEQPTRHQSRLKTSTKNFRESVFFNLQAHQVRLQEWLWNSSFIAHKQLVFQLFDIHSQQPFQSLRRLTFIDYDGSPFKDEELARGINKLPQLRELSFHNVKIIGRKLFSLLSTELEVLEITDCPLITSEWLNSFLVPHGQSIQRLILLHNKSLNLSFLSELDAKCPQIEYMRVDLGFSNAKFETLLLPNEIPRWPSSLQHLELFHLRKWDLKVADMFFSSLVNSAAVLPNLRQLKIKASLEESGWRDRIAFRDKWMARLRNVFLRASPPPNPHFRSIDAFHDHKRHLTASDSKTSFINLASPKLFLPISKIHQRDGDFSHIEIKPPTGNAHQSNIENGNEIGIQKTQTRRSKRIQLQEQDHQSNFSHFSPPPRRRRSRRPKRHSSDDPSTAEDSALDDCTETPSSNTSAADQDLHIQGMCDVVSILLDNLRPTEDHFDENDFLDEEISGDEDWNGEDGYESEGVYAW